MAIFARCFGAVGTRKRFVWFVWSILTVGYILLGVFAGLTATSLEKLTAEIRKSNSDDTTRMRMFALLQANCVGSIIFAMLHFITSLAFLMGRWFTSAPPGMLFGILCMQTASNVCLMLAMASPLVAYDIDMEDLSGQGLKASGIDLWAEQQLSLYRVAFALMFAVGAANGVFFGTLLMARSVFGTAPAPPQQERRGFWSRRRDEEAPPPPPPAAAEKPGFFGRFGRGEDQAPATSPPPPPVQRSASPETTRSNPLFHFGRGDDDHAPPPPPPRYQAPEAPARPAFAGAFAGGRFASGDSNPFGDPGGGGASDNPFASPAGAVAWGAATSPGAASRGAALYEMSSRR